MADSTYGKEDQEPLHVLDLPQLYTKPSSKTLLEALAHLAITPASWDNDHSAYSEKPSPVNQAGVTSYLTSIVSSPLQWIDGDERKDEIWELASIRLSERCGRTAMPAISRTFRIPTSASTVDIVLNEPSLTADNLGLKTWASSYLLAKRLQLLHFPRAVHGQRPRALELGSGTGLVGIAAAAIRAAFVHLTDLPDILPNLRRNVQENEELITSHGGAATTGVLDWSDDGNSPLPYDGAEGALNDNCRFPIIFAADPLYSPQHPQLLVQTINKWLAKSQQARVIVELPLRNAYMPEINEFKERMETSALTIIDQGEEIGYDDWGGEVEGDLREVRCWWAMWAWAKEENGME